MSKIIIASGPVIVEDGKVLLNKHGEDSFYKFCGGRVESFEENLDNAAKREVKEEMGIDIKIINSVPYIMHAKKPGQEDVDVILVHYLAERVGDIEPGADIREWNWVAIEELESNELAPNILPVLRYFGFLG